MFTGLVGTDNDVANKSNTRKNKEKTTQQNGIEMNPKKRMNVRREGHREKHFETQKQKFNAICSFDNLETTEGNQEKN